MGASEKISAEFDKIKGKAEEAVGRLTDDEKKIAEGKLTQAKGDLKSGAEKAKDTVKDAFDK